jgi:putative thiamine transport system permease protein
MARPSLLRLGPLLAIGALILPVAAGLAGTILPAFGVLPALGGLELTLAHFGRLAAEPGIWRSAGLSLASGLGATLIALAIVALFLAAASERAVMRMRGLLSPLLAAPHAAAAFGFAFFIAPSGLVSRMVSPGLTGWERPPDILFPNDPMAFALTAGLAAKEIPFLLLIALAALPQIAVRPSRQIAASLGHGRMAGFFHTVWPGLYRQIRLGVFAVIAFATSVTDVALILGPQTPPVLAARLLEWMNDPDLSLRFLAAAGALLQLAVTLAAFAIWLGLERIGAHVRERLAASGTRLANDTWARNSAIAAMALPALTLAGGIATLALWSVARLWQFPDALPSGLTFAGWRAALPRLSDAIVTTVTTGLAASAIALVLAVLCLMRQDEKAAGLRIAGGAAPPGFVDRHGLALLYVPLLVPQAAFLFGLQFLLITLQADGMFASLVAVHLVFVLPYVFLSLSDPWRALDRRLPIIAAALGHGPGAVFWRVRAPLLLGALLAAFALGFAVSSAQYLATALAGAGRLSTVTTEAVALASGGNRRVIGIHAMVQMALPAIAFAIASLVPAWLWRNRRGMRAA